MTILTDTRQKKGQHCIKEQYFDKHAINTIRTKLVFGDYCLPPTISVDTKANMAEIANNIGSDHKRFKNECILARDAGCQLIILVENTDGIHTIEDVHTWINPDLVYRPKAITGERLQKAMCTMSERYGVKFEFCTPEESAKRILELLGVEHE